MVAHRTVTRAHLRSRASLRDSYPPVTFTSVGWFEPSTLIDTWIRRGGDTCRLSMGLITTHASEKRH